MQNNDQEKELDLRDFLVMLWRRKTALLSIICIGLFLSVFAIQILKPRYMARNLLLLQTPEKAASVMVDMQSTLMSSMSFDHALVLGQIEVLRSRTLARGVIERLGLMSDPEFNTYLDGNPLLVSQFQKFNVQKSRMRDLPPEVLNREVAEVVHNFLEQLRVRPVSGSYAIQISFESVDPVKAALIANTIADLYIQQRMEAKYQSARKMTAWLDKRLNALQSQVRAAESAVESYRARHNLDLGERNVLSAEQLSELNSQLLRAKAASAEAQARLEQVKNLSEEQYGLAKLSELVDSDFLRELKLERARIEAKISKFSSRYGEKHPEMIKVRLELSEIKKTIEEEILKIRETMKGEASFAQARVRALEDGVRNLTDQRNLDHAAMIKLRELEREAQSTRMIYDTFLQTYKRSDNQEELQEADARIVSYAVVPHRASFPNKILILVLGLLLSIFAGLLSVILLEKLDNSYKSAHQLERFLGFPCLSLIPVVRGAGKHVGSFTLDYPTSITAEAVRTLRALLNLQVPEGKKRPQVIAMTSSVSGEGKTTLALWLARQAARSGEKVIVIDADMRKPNLHMVLGQAYERSIVDHLSGRAALGDIVHRDQESGAHIIFSAAVPDRALDLLGAGKMQQLITSLRQIYDLVIIDTPACLAVSDATMMTQVADQTLYAVAWNKTPREIVGSGVKRFTDIAYKKMAFVLTHVDIHKHAKYGYGDTPYYYGPDLV